MSLKQVLTSLVILPDSRRSSTTQTIESSFTLYSFEQAKLEPEKFPPKNVIPNSGKPQITEAKAKSYSFPQKEYATISSPKQVSDIVWIINIG